MPKYHGLWILFMAVWFISIKGEDLQCTHSEKCDCYRSNELEYHCPRVDSGTRDDDQIVIHTIPHKSLKITCPVNIREFDLDMLPDMNLGDLQEFYMMCPLPPYSFNATLKKFQIVNIQYLKLELARSYDPQVIKKELFYGINQLSKLSLSYFNLELEEDFLMYLPNLTFLYLDKVEIKEVKKDTFKYVPNLKILHLTRNLLSELPDRLFAGLSDLQQLHLWGNKLVSLNNNLFTGLGQLKSLELSSNKIMFVEESAFKELRNLVNISLRSNNLQEIPSNIFQFNVALEGIRIGDNPNINLSDYVFANLKNLLNVNIDFSNLETLPQHLFEGSNALRHISLKGNKIVKLPESIFRNLTKLKTLNLEGNKIETLPIRIFVSLTHLEELYLQGNELKKINTVFGETIHLKVLNLRQNKISSINNFAFSSLTELTDLDLSYNQYSINQDHGTFNEGINPFTYCTNLKKLNLSHNKITSFPENIILSNVKFEKLDLDFNKIGAVRIASLINASARKVVVSLNNNNISILDFIEIKAINKSEIDTTSNPTVLHLSNNPIRCDCSNYDLFKYVNNEYPQVKAFIEIVVEDLHCVIPEFSTHILVKQIKPYQVTCPISTDGCPTQCSCAYRPYDAHALVNCSHINLTNPPLINFMKPVKINYAPSYYAENLNINKIIVYLEGNFIQAAPVKGWGYENVTKMYLSNNQIKNISWIPPKIEVLHLDGNQLGSLDSTVLNSFNKTILKNLTLYGNPWKCGCSAVALQRFLGNFYKKVVSEEVVCEDNKPLIEKKDLCKSHLITIVAIVMPLLIVLFIAASIVALYFYYQEQIKVWLYAKNLCLWFVTAEELDKDKTYDVFISYSHKDEDFVLQNLLPVLEQGPNPFKVCIHIRDWVPGEFIARQVTNSVLDSRRTLVVLSESFLESVWGKMEFRTAHTQAISDGQARVIVIKYGPINEEKLDNELKSYLKTNTYVEWGDPWFWNKLKYALPHSRENKFYNNNQKHANIMLKIDDKFELVTSSPVIHAESTPPVIPLNPSLLKDHPLNLKNGEVLASESPLIKS